MPPIRRPTLDENNRWFTAVVIGGGGVAGSLVSFLYSSALVLGVWRLSLGLIALPRERAVRLIGASFLAYFAAEALATLVNYAGPHDLLAIVANLPFIAFLLVFGRLSLTPRADVLRWTEYGSIGGAYGAGLFALVEVFVRGFPRAEGLAGNSGPFALVCAILFGFCVAIAIYRHDRMRGIAGGAALFAAVGLILSGMRSLWPMLLIAPALLAWLLDFIPNTLFTRRTALVAAAAAVIVASLGYSTVETRVMSLVKDIEKVDAGNYDNSLGLRIRVWDAALELIAQKPVFGQGPAHARSALQTAASERGEKEISFSHAHNLVLNTLMRSGVFGLAAVIAMFAVPLWAAGRRDKDEIGRIGYALMVTFCTTYLVNGAFNVSLGHDIVDALFLYCMITTAYLVFGASGTPRCILLADGSRATNPAALAAI
ncbi:MAG: O-antigen ligase family protein [Mesorhizobium sp.]|nr:O-antigen ligase family protein [Mesorhizobium sp.]MCO5159965.1 O-antigen ligase family protein [Mesorhizobium sp.]